MRELEFENEFNEILKKRINDEELFLDGNFDNF